MDRGRLASSTIKTQGRHQANPSRSRRRSNCLLLSERFLTEQVVGRKAYVEFRGEATQLNGKPYNNYYLWIMIFDESGHAKEIREYMDTGLVKEVFTNN